MVWINMQHINREGAPDRLGGGAICMCQDCRKARAAESIMSDEAVSNMTLNGIAIMQLLDSVSGGAAERRIEMAIWKKYRKTAVQEMRDYVPGENLTGISVAPGEIPKAGGKIARDGQGSHWYISPEFFDGSYQPDDDAAISPADKFVHHIKEHLAPDQDVLCKICGKTFTEITNS